MNYRDPDVLAAIAADDPGGTIESAHATLAAMTVTDPQIVPMGRFVGLLYQLGRFVAILQAAQAGTASAASAVAVIEKAKALGIEGVDMSLQSTTDLMNALQVDGLLTTDDITALQALGQVERTKYPGLRQVHVQMARGEA